MRWAVLLAAAVLTGCGSGQNPAVARFTAGDVDVTIAVSARVVDVTFRPTRPGFHIYGLELPPGGLGVPTRVSVGAGLEATGAPGASEPVRWLMLPSLGTRLPVYPDGPVTISLPVRRTAHAVEVVVSYAACSRTVCLTPVIDRVTKVRIPA